MGTLTTCIVSLCDVEKVTHTVEVQAESLFAAAAAAVAVFQREPWAVRALTPAAALRVEIRAPAVVHTVPLTALERWQRSPSTSPKQQLAKGGSAGS